MTRLLVLLRAAPITVPCLAVLPLLGWWAADGAGYTVGRWAPGALLVLGLLGVALVLVPNAWGDVPRPVVIAAALLGAFTAWSYASIGWAADGGAALEGANRTLLYLALFCLFALWRQRGRSAAILVCGWALGVIAIAVTTAVRLTAQADPTTLFAEDRLATPVGYPNAAAATFAMALWPAIVLASAARVPPVVRGLCAGGAVLLADLALLALSRGALLAVPLTGLVLLAVVPGRLRTLATLVVVGAGVALSARPALAVGDALTGDGADPAVAIANAGGAMLFAAALVGALVAGAAAWETARPPSAGTRRTATRAGQVLAGLAAAALLVGALAADPVQRLDNAWTSFKGGYGDGSAASTRLTSGLGSNRYDFYRVAWGEFRDAPLVGIGGDNYQQAYLVGGSSEETPRYPHSVELRTLSQFGVVGAALLLGALLAAAWAAWLGMRPGGRRGDGGLRAAVGGAALVGAAYVFVHGSADWFWETAGLSGAAFALLGLAAGLAPRPDAARAFTTRASTPVELVGVAAVVLVGFVVVGAPWLGLREEQRASAAFAAEPAEAYGRLDRAASLNPLSDRPRLLEGSIAVRLGDRERARRAFASALARVPDGQYATLQQGALASVRGDRAAALELLGRAARLAPRDPTAREALAVVRDGGTIDLVNLSRRILGAAEEIGGEAGADLAR